VQSSSHVDPEKLTSQLIAATAAARRILSIWDGDARQAVHINFEELGAAFQEIMHARAALERIPQNPSSALAEALAQYRSALERLRPHLPGFEGWLLTERARLHGRHGHATAVSSWADTFRDVAKVLSRRNAATKT
jgi:hypothetical protein